MVDSLRLKLVLGGAMGLTWAGFCSDDCFRPLTVPNGVKGVRRAAGVGVVLVLPDDPYMPPAPLLFKYGFSIPPVVLGDLALKDVPPPNRDDDGVLFMLNGD